MSQEIKKEFQRLLEKGRELSGEEMGIISALMEHEHLLVQQYEKEKQELSEEFLEKLEALPIEYVTWIGSDKIRRKRNDDMGKVQSAMIFLPDITRLKMELKERIK